MVEGPVVNDCQPLVMNDGTKRKYPTHSHTLLFLKWPRFYSVLPSHTHARWSDIFIHNPTTRLFGSFLPLNGETESHCLLLSVLCSSAPWLPSDRPVGPINRYVSVLIFACLWNRKGGTKERERERVADMVDMLPAIVAERGPGIKEGQCSFGSQSC